MYELYVGKVTYYTDRNPHKVVVSYRIRTYESRYVKYL